METTSWRLAGAPLWSLVAVALSSCAVPTEKATEHLFEEGLLGTWRDDVATTTVAFEGDHTFVASRVPSVGFPAGASRGSWTATYDTVTLSGDGYSARYRRRFEASDKRLVLLQVDATGQPAEPLVTLALQKSEGGYCQEAKDCAHQPLVKPAAPGAWRCEESACAFEASPPCDSEPTIERITKTSTVGAPSGRTSHTAVWTGTELLIWGGSRESGPLGDGGRYDPQTDSWAPLSNDGAPSPRWSHVAVWTGEEMAIFGGRSASGQNLRDGALYDPATDSWEPLPECTDCPQPVGKAVRMGDALLFWVSSLDRGGAVFDLQSRAWHTIGAPALSDSSERVTGEAVEWTGTELYAYFMHYGEMYGVRDRCSRFDPVAMQWSECSHALAPYALQSALTGFGGGQLIVFEPIRWGIGGYGTNTQGGTFDPAVGLWQPTATGPKHSYNVMRWVDPEAILCRPHEGHGGTDCVRYDPVTRIWSAETLVSDKTFSLSTSTVTAANGELIVWGGSTVQMVNGFEIRTSSSNEGVRYAPPRCPSHEQ